MYCITKQREDKEPPQTTGVTMNNESTTEPSS